MLVYIFIWISVSQPGVRALPGGREHIAGDARAVIPEYNLYLYNYFYNNYYQYNFFKKIEIIVITYIV